MGDYQKTGETKRRRIKDAVPFSLSKHEDSRNVRVLDLPLISEGRMQETTQKPTTQTLSRAVVCSWGSLISPRNHLLFLQNCLWPRVFPLSLNREVKNLLDLTGRLSTQLPLMPLCTEQTYESFFFLIHLLSVHLNGLYYGHMSGQRISLLSSTSILLGGVIKHTALCTEDPLLQLEALAVMDFCQLMCLRLFFLLLFSTASCS